MLGSCKPALDIGLAWSLGFCFDQLIPLGFFIAAPLGGFRFMPAS